MSLLDAFLRDALLATVVQSDVWFAIRKDGARGSGKQDDPFDGSTAAAFDSVMASLASNTSLTIHLGPTTSGHEFKTMGGSAWQPQSGWRVVGAGIDATTLQVVNSTASADIVAIGKPTPDAFLEGFEVSDLTIDCNLAGSGASASIGGVSVTGNNVFLRRVRVKNYGRKASGLCVALSAAWAATGTPPFEPFNCVIEECIVTPPASQSHSAAKLVALRLGNAGTSAAWHTGCVIRDCYVDGGDYPADPAPKLQKDIRGIVASGGKGTIIEGNRILNCQHGGPFQDANDSMPGWDIVIRNNVFLKVKEGPSLTLADTKTTERVCALYNWVELGISGNATGIRLNLSAANGFTNVILRSNVVRYDPHPGSIASTDYGIHLTGCTNAIVENNLIDVGTPDRAVYHSNSGAVSPFNNQTNAGAFRPGYDGTTGFHDAELTTDVEDVILGV